MPDPFAVIDAAGSTVSPQTGAPEAAADPFAFIDSGGAIGDRLAATTRLGLIKDPARSARVLKMRDRIGMPSDFIDRNLDQVEQETARQGFDPAAFRRDSPLVASWLEQAPEYAAVSRDDLGRLAAVEKLVADSPNYKFQPNGRIIGPAYNDGTLADEFTPLSLLRRLQQDDANRIVDDVTAQMEADQAKDRGAFEAGFIQSGGSALRLVQSLTGQDSDATKRQLDRIARASATNDPGFWNDVVRGMGGLAADAPLMLAGGALAPLGRLKTLMGGGKLAGMAATAIAVQPLALREGILAGQDNGWANGLASWGIETVVPAAFGPTGVEKIIERLAARGVARESAGGFAAAAGGLLTQAGLEATEEGVTELAHALHEVISGIDPEALTGAKLWPRLGVAGVVGAAGGAGFNLPGAIAQMAAKGDTGGQVQRIEAALQAQALVQRLTDAASESTTAQNYEAGAKTLFQTITAGKAEQVYIDREGWDEVARKAGMDPRAAAIELIGGPPLVVGEPVDPKRARSLELAARAYDEAARTGAPLAIKTADLAFYLARKKEIADAVAKEIRLDPQAMNVREAEFELTAMATIPAAPGEQAQNTAQEESAAIQGEIEQDLAAQGYSADAARRNAVQMASVFRTQASRFNEGKAPDDPTRLTPAKLWQEWGVSINRSVADILAKPTFQTADQTLAAMRSRLKAQAYAKADAALAERDAARAAAQGQADQQLAQDAAGEAGEALITEATAALEQARAPGGLTYGDAMRVLGADFGFKPDATAAKLTPEQTRRGNLLALALRTRGGSLASLIEDAGASRPDPAATTARQAAPVKDDPRLEKLAADGLRLRDLVAYIQAGRGDLAELEQAAALAQEVGPELNRLPLDQERIEDIRAAVEFAQDGQTLNQGRELAAGKRGSITFGGKPNERRTLIRLFESADLSTFLHESGHLYLEVLADLAARPGAPAQIKADLAQALAYIGATDYASITTEQHETWARSWEAYLMEGKAPTAELRGVFARFAAWMASLYRSVKGLAVELSPEVRGVMDRLIATQEEIDAAAKSMGDDGFSAHAAEMGLSPEQAAQIVKADAEAFTQAQNDLQAQAMREIRREQEAHWQELRAEVLAEVEEEVNAQPVYIAESVLRRGTLPGGAPLREGMPAVKLDAAEIRQRMASRFASKEEQDANLKRLAMMRSSTSGIPLDQAAELFGFDSGADLLQGLLTMRPRKELIEAETDARMRQRFGDILTDGTIAEKAMDALHGEKRADVHQAKVQALARKVGKKSAPIEVMRAAAEARIAETPAGDVLPHLYLRAEVKAREQVQKHLAKQEWDGALAAKQRELLNHELYRAAIQARKDIDSALEYAKKFDEQKTRERVGKAGGWEWTVTAKDGARFQFPTEEDARQAAAKLGTTTWERTSGYLEQIDGLRERYSLKRGTAKDAERRQSLNAWVAQQQAAGVPVNLPPQLLNEARKVNWRKAPVADLIGLRDGLAHINHLANTKNKLSKAKKQRELLALARTLAATLERTKPNPKPADAEDGRGSKTMEKAADFWAAHRKAASLLREMDGWEDGGEWTAALMRPMNEAADYEATLAWAAKQKQDALWDAWHSSIGKTDWQPNDRRPFAGFRGGLTRMGSIMVALNWGNEGNRARLLEGNRLTEGQVQAVLDSLTAADWNLVEGVWEHIDSYWSEIQALEQRVTGVAPEKVEAAPFPTKHGTIKGGYFPIINNKEAATARIDGEAKDWAAQMAAQAFGRAVTKHGHTKARAAMGLGQPLSLDPNAIGRHLTQVIHDLTHREALNDAARILATAGDSIDRHMGTRTTAQLKTWLGDIATGGRPATGAAKMMGWLRRGFSMAAMGFRPMTAALQFTGFINGAQRVGVGRMAYAMRQLFDTPAGFDSSFQLAMSKSKMLANRMRTQTQDITEVMGGIKRDRFSQFQEGATRYGFWMIQKMQTVVDTATWLAGYAQAIEGGASEADAIAQADQVVLDTQSGGQIKDLSGVQRDAYGQAFTGAFTYGAMLFNQLHDVAGGTAARYRSGDKAGAFVQGFTGFMLTAALPAAMTLALRELLKGTPERERDPYLKRYGIELLSTIMGTMIGVRELSGSIQGFSYQGPATTKTLGAYSDLLVQIGQGELDKNLLRAANDAILGTLAMPAGQVWATGTGFLDWMDDPSIDLRPIVFGPPPKR